ncbi:MAG: NAD(P)-dependent oxidoreductase [Acidimicrobiales bacterium]
MTDLEPTPPQDLTGRTVAVTGAAGFIGAFTVAELAGRGATVLALDRDPGPRSQLTTLVDSGRVRFVPTGTRWPYPESWWTDTVRSGLLTDVDTVVHMGYAEPKTPGPYTEYRKEMVDNTLPSIDLLSRLGSGTTTVCVASSSLVYGRGHRGPIGEDQPVRPDSPYGQAKHDLEQALRWWTTGGRTTVAVRLATVYGPTETVPRAAPNFIRRILAGRRPEVAVAADQRDYIHVADVARGVAALVAATETGDIGPGSTELNLGTGIPTTTLELARILLDLAGVEADGLSPVVSEPTRDPVSLVVDPARLIAATGFRPSIPLATGLAEEMAWLRSHPELWVEERAK